MLVLLAALLTAAAGQAQLAPGIVDTAKIAAFVDLAPFVKVVETDQRVYAFTGPSDGQGNAASLSLEAKGPGPLFRWATVAIVNTSQKTADVALVLPDRSFAGSGLIWPRTPGSRVVATVVSGGSEASRLKAPGSNSFAAAIGPGQGLIMALELSEPGASGLELWTREAFDEHESSQAFQRGVVLGIAALLGLVMIALYSVRRIAAFPAGFIFAAASLLFIGIEAGFLPRLNQAFAGWGISFGPAARAIVESLMLTGLILCLVTFVELRRRLNIVGNTMLALAGVSLALIVYAFFEPARASGIARMAFAATAALAIGVVYVLRREGHARAIASFPAWVALGLWTLLAAYAALTAGNETFMRPLLSLMLVLVLMTMAFALAQFAFSNGFLSNRFFEESGRRALALAGAQQYVWDWNVEDEELYVGEELERAIGARPGFLAETGAGGWNELLHPADRPAYETAILNAKRRGTGAFASDFRLRSAEGAYRWFHLSARVMPGPDARPIRLIGTLSDVTGTKRAEERLLSDAVYDRVTGLPNKALFMDRLERAMAAAVQGRQLEIYVVVIDLDRFKTVNDGLGHDAGDALLNATGRRLQAIAGLEDTVARLPGDQFAVMFANGDGSRDIASFTEHLRDAISRPVVLEPKDVYLTASAGVCRHESRDQTPADLLRDASVALYSAKRQGKEAIVFFSGALHDDRNELLSLESDLRQAADRGEIEVYYQPIARLETMDLAGFEALMRWRHPQRGLLGPESFMNLAEQTGIIREIGRHVLNDAARQLGVWQRAFRQRDPLFIAVNVSASQLAIPGLAEEVKAILAREGIARGTLKIEVTESAVMESPELAARVLEKLQAMGVGLACDDFGTGYSSLATLRRLPFDSLKVDKSFVAADPADARAAVILQAIIALAHDLGLSVVAEGIERQDQVNRLGALRCDYGQGYFIGEPLAAKQVTEALAAMPYTSAPDTTGIGVLQEKAPPPPPPPSQEWDGQLPRLAPAIMLEELPPLPPRIEESPAQAELAPVGTAPMAPRRARRQALDEPPPAETGEPPADGPAPEPVLVLPPLAGAKKPLAKRKRKRPPTGRPRGRPRKNPLPPPKGEG
jgi:diguanylate cyclase (GGDEF)-like protein/PAS domain S-box-containing protein